MKQIKNLAVAGLIAISVTANAQIRITEFASGGAYGEFIELTNIGNTAIDVAGWSYDDSSQIPGVFDLSGFGVINSFETVLLTEDPAADFRTGWSLSSTVRILDGYTNNLGGGGDEINIYDASNSLVDQLTYTSTAPTPNISRNGPLTSLGANDYSAWQESFAGDVFGSYESLTAGTIGNPGSYDPVPEPATMTVLAIAALAAARKRRSN